MRTHRAVAKIIPFPESGQPRKPPILITDFLEYEMRPWPTAAFDTGAGPTEEPLDWLERSLVDARCRAITLLRALAQLPRFVIPGEVENGPIRDFEACGLRFLPALELLRMGQIPSQDMQAIVRPLHNSFQQLRLLRNRILTELDSSVRSEVQALEARHPVTALDVERELMLRSCHRTGEPELYESHLALPGEIVMTVAGPNELDRRRRRERRIEQDHRFINCDMDLAGWLEELPEAWLAGMARALNVPQNDDRWDLETEVRDKLSHGGGVQYVVSNLGFYERRILRRILKAGGMLRYDDLVFHFGGDDEYAWHWAEEVPTSPLERVRRTGLVFVGLVQIGRRAHRMAVIPADLRRLLQPLLGLKLAQ